MRQHCFVFFLVTTKIWHLKTAKHPKSFSFSVIGCFFDAAILPVLQGEKRPKIGKIKLLGRIGSALLCLSAMELVAGALCGYSDVSNKKIKDGHYALVQRLANEFKKEFGSYYCRDILKTDDTLPVSTERTADFYETRPCLSCIKAACDILDKELF